MRQDPDETRQVSGRGRRRRGRLLLGVVCLVVGCATNPVTAQRNLAVFTEQQEINLGREADREIIRQFGYYDDPQIQQYVNQVGQRVARVSARRNLTYTFKVVDSPQVNAFALPGGFIYVTRGILAELNSEAELAGILGHEVTHVDARHGIQQLTRALGASILSILAAVGTRDPNWGGAATLIFQNILNGYGREAEYEADRVGLYYTYQAGYDPRALAGFLRRLANRERVLVGGYHSLAATHPETSQRLDRVETFAQIRIQRGEQQALVVGLNEYRARLDGLVYGESAAFPLKRLKIYTVGAGDTLAAIALKVYGNPNWARELAEFNGLSPTAALAPGTLLKIPPR